MAPFDLAGDNAGHFVTKIKNDLDILAEKNTVSKFLPKKVLV